MNKLIEVFRRFGPRYRFKYDRNMLPSHYKALKNIDDCRTSVYGKYVGACEECGEVEELKGACRNRACPKCNNSRTQEWIDKQKERLPSMAYYHTVFTVPSELRFIARKNQKVFYEKLMWAVGETLAAFGHGDRQVHGKIGYVTFLHTWDSKMNFHPHVHVLMMGGYLDKYGSWVEVKRKEIFPVRALARMFKTKLLKSLRCALDENIPSRFHNLSFVVYTKRNVPGSKHVIEYLGRYVKRLGIGPSRIQKVDKKGVEFRYRHRVEKGVQDWKTMKLSGEEFLRRYLQHILPKGFVRVRYYGLLHSNCAEKLEAIKEALEGPKENEKAIENKEVGKRSCKSCHVPLVTMLLIIPAFFKVRKEKSTKFYLYKEETEKGVEKDPDKDECREPYNKLFKSTALGRHGPRLREARAGSSSPLPCGAGA